MHSAIGDNCRQSSTHAHPFSAADVRAWSPPLPTTRITHFTNPPLPAQDYPTTTKGRKEQYFAFFFKKKFHHLCEFYLKVRKYRLIVGTSSLTECKNSTVRWYFTNHHWSGAPPLNSSPPPFTAAQKFWAYAAIYQPGEGGGGS